MPDFTELQRRLRGVCSRYGSDLQVLIEHPASGFLFRHNSVSEFPSASIIKLFILDYVLEHEKRLGAHVPSASLPMTDDSILNFFSGSTLTVRAMLSLMIDVSDNTATNYLIGRYGMDGINRHILSNGWRRTVLRRRMLDFEARAAGLENTTSLDETFDLIKRHVQNTENRKSRLFLDMMLHQHDRSRIALLLPEGVTGSKSGSLDNVYGDVAFITAGGYSYAGFLSRNGAAGAARTFIPRLSLLFYRAVAPV